MSSTCSAASESKVSDRTMQIIERLRNIGRIISMEELGGQAWPDHLRTVSEASERIAELEAALRDCIPFLAVGMDKYLRDFGLSSLHPTHAEIIDRVSRLTGGEKLSDKLKA